MSLHNPVKGSSVGQKYPIGILRTIPPYNSLGNNSAEISTYQQTLLESRTHDKEMKRLAKMEHL